MGQGSAAFVWVRVRVVLGVGLAICFFFLARLREEVFRLEGEDFIRAGIGWDSAPF